MKKITDKHEIEQLQASLLPRLINDYALITAGPIDDFNTMTIAWGSFGDMWWRPVIDAYVVPSRYTYEFIEREDVFTVQFFGPEQRDALMLLGTKSGRDGDKVAESGLTPQALGDAVTFAEADTTLVCRKLHSQPLDPAAIPTDIMESTYANMGVHTQYIAEIVEAYVAE